MRSGTQDKEQHPATGRMLHPKENWQECATRRPMDDETKRLQRNTAVCLRSRKSRLSANRRQVALEGSEKTNRSRRKGGQHTLKALHFLRRSRVAMPLSTRCFANSPPCWGSVLSTSATFAQNLWRKSQNSTDFSQNQWSFFCSCATWSKSLRSAGQK